MESRGSAFLALAASPPRGVTHDHFPLRSSLVFSVVAAAVALWLSLHAFVPHISGGGLLWSTDDSSAPPPSRACLFSVAECVPSHTPRSVSPTFAGPLLRELSSAPPAQTHPSSQPFSFSRRARTFNAPVLRAIGALPADAAYAVHREPQEPQEPLLSSGKELQQHRSVVAAATLDKVRVKLCFFVHDAITTRAVSAFFAAQHFLPLYPRLFFNTSDMVFIGPGGLTPRNFGIAETLAENKDCTAVIGPGWSSIAVAVNVLVDSLWVGYSATSTALSDKATYPLFSRVIPSDAAVSFGIVQLMRHYSWTLVNLFCEDTSYGRSVVQGISEKLNALGISTALSRCYAADTTAAGMSAFFDDLQNGDSRIVAMGVTASTPLFGNFIDEVLRRGMQQNFVFIFSESACSNAATAWLKLPGAFCVTAATDNAQLGPYQSAFNAASPSFQALVHERLAEAGITAANIKPPSFATHTLSAFDVFAADAAHFALAVMDDAAAAVLADPAAGSSNSVTINGSAVLVANKSGAFKGQLLTSRGRNVRMASGLTGTVAVNADGDRAASSFAIFNTVGPSFDDAANKYYTASRALVVQADGNVTMDRMPYWADRGFSSQPPPSLTPKALAGPPAADRMPYYIAGGVVVLLIICLLVILVVFLYRRWKKRSRVPQDQSKPFAAFFVSVKNEIALREQLGEAASTAVCARVERLVAEMADDHDCHVARRLESHFLVVATNAAAATRCVAAITAETEKTKFTQEIQRAAQAARRQAVKEKHGSFGGVVFASDIRSAAGSTHGSIAPSHHGSVLPSRTGSRVMNRNHALIARSSKASEESHDWEAVSFGAGGSPPPSHLNAGHIPILPQSAPAHPTPAPAGTVAGTSGGLPAVKWQAHAAGGSAGGGNSTIVMPSGAVHGPGLVGVAPTTPHNTSGFLGTGLLTGLGKRTSTDTKASDARNASVERSPNVPATFDATMSPQPSVTSVQDGQRVNVLVGVADEAESAEIEHDDDDESLKSITITPSSSVSGSRRNSLQHRAGSNVRQSSTSQPGDGGVGRWSPSAVVGGEVESPRQGGNPLRSPRSVHVPSNGKPAAAAIRANPRSGQSFASRPPVVSARTGTFHHNGQRTAMTSTDASQDTRRTTGVLGTVQSSNGESGGSALPSIAVHITIGCAFAVGRITGDGDRIDSLRFAGHPVDHAAALADLARPGQVLATETFARLAAGLSNSRRKSFGASLGRKPVVPPALDDSADDLAELTATAGLPGFFDKYCTRKLPGMSRSAAHSVITQFNTKGCVVREYPPPGKKALASSTRSRPGFEVTSFEITGNQVGEPNPSPRAASEDKKEEDVPDSDEEELMRVSGGACLNALEVASGGLATRVVAVTAIHVPALEDAKSDGVGRRAESVLKEVQVISDQHQGKIVSTIGGTIVVAVNAVGKPVMRPERRVALLAQAAVEVIVSETQCVAAAAVDCGSAAVGGTGGRSDVLTATLIGERATVLARYAASSLLAARVVDFQREKAIAQIHSAALIPSGNTSVTSIKAGLGLGGSLTTPGSQRESPRPPMGAHTAVLGGDPFSTSVLAAAPGHAQPRPASQPSVLSESSRRPSGAEQEPREQQSSTTALPVVVPGLGSPRPPPARASVDTSMAPLTIPGVAQTITNSLMNVTSVLNTLVPATTLTCTPQMVVGDVAQVAVTGNNVVDIATDGSGGVGAPVPAVDDLLPRCLTTHTAQRALSIDFRLRACDIVEWRRAPPLTAAMRPEFFFNNSSSCGPAVGLSGGASSPTATTISSSIMHSGGSFPAAVFALEGLTPMQDEPEDEWMYQLSSAQSKDPNAANNATFAALAAADEAGADGCIRGAAETQAVADATAAFEAARQVRGRTFGAKVKAYARHRANIITQPFPGYVVRGNASPR